MTVAIQRSNGDLIWFDAVLSYRRDYRSSVTRHPIEDGSVVTDNVSKENPKFSISGVIANADFNTTRPFISTAEAKSFGLSERGIYNSQPIQGTKSGVADNGVEYVQEGGPVIGGGPSPLLKFLPETVTQFIDGQPPSVEVPDQQRPDWVEEVQEILKSVERGNELVTVLEFKGNIIQKAIFNCYVTTLSINETVDTGDAVDVTLDLEQVTFVTLREEKLSADVVEKLSKKSASKSNKGNVSATKVDGEAPDAKSGKTDIAPLKGALGLND
jgi:hypothetical protein